MQHVLQDPCISVMVMVCTFEFLFTYIKIVFKKLNNNSQFNLEIFPTDILELFI